MQNPESGIWRSKVYRQSSRKGLKEGLGNSGQLAPWNLESQVVVHLGAVWAQVGMGVLESGDGAVTQAPRDRHQCVEVLQFVEPLGQERWEGQMGASQLSWGAPRRVWVCTRVGVGQVREGDFVR